MGWIQAWWRQLRLESEAEDYTEARKIEKELLDAISAAEVKSNEANVRPRKSPKRPKRSRGVAS